MKILLVGINSKFTHTLLALPLIKHYVKSDDIVTYQSNVNVDIGKVLYEIGSFDADVVAFSCYIFNIEFLKKLVPAFRKLHPSVKLLFGGPEPYSDEFASEESHIDMEGERYFHNLVYGKNDTSLIDMDDLYGVYDEDFLHKLGSRPLYYEASRGCPFSCSYCMSGAKEKLRTKSINVIKKELLFFIKSGVKQVKFLDRTFNADAKFANEILTFILQNNVDTAFHFEVSADIFKQETLDIIQSFPSGILEFEIGIQSFNAKTLKELRRKSDLSRVCDNIKKLVAFNNCHVHVDLIAGLPYEGYESFKQSFNSCFELGAHVIQLGTLKLLKNTLLRDNNLEYDYRFFDTAPYEVLSNNDLSFEEMVEIKKVEFAVSKFYNTKLFCTALDYICEKYDSPFDAFSALGNFIYGLGLYKAMLSRDKKIEILKQFMADDEIFIDLLRFDFLHFENTQSLCQTLYQVYDDEIKKLNKDRGKAHIKLQINPITKEKDECLVTFDRTNYDKTAQTYAFTIENIK